MLTSLVKLGTDNGPGAGFYTLAEREHFFDPSHHDEMDFWQDQVGKAHDSYRRTTPRHAGQEG